MAVWDQLLRPLGLLVLLAAIPIIILYLIKPDPNRIAIPTLQFLTEERGEEQVHPYFERIKRSLLLLLQLLILLALVLSLAGPYITVPAETAVDETVIVLDASASMQTTMGDTTRFERARRLAAEATTGRTSVVLASNPPQVPLQRGSTQDASQTLASVEPTQTAASLKQAITQGTALAGNNAKIVVLSDFAGDQDWKTAVEMARGRGHLVQLRQIGDGETNNVGITDRQFSGASVTVTVTNFGETEAERTLTLGNQQTTLTIPPGSGRTHDFNIPAGGGTVELRQGDAFPVDDRVPIAAPSDSVVDVLVVTNDGNRYLDTALSVMDQVNHTTKHPPTSLTREYDVILFTGVNADDLLRGTVEHARDTVANGGGVGILAQEDLDSVDRYEDLLIIQLGSMADRPQLQSDPDHPLTESLSFPPPDRYFQGTVLNGSTPVRTAGGTPIIAIQERPPGRVLYYGYFDSSGPFRFHYQYPVFWKRAVFALAGREPLPALNYRTGQRWILESPTTVETPSGRLSGVSSVPLQSVGFYSAGEKRVGVGLLDPTESDVAPASISSDNTTGGAGSRMETQFVPRSLTPVLIALSVVLVIIEIAYLRRRGDL